MRSTSSSSQAIGYWSSADERRLLPAAQEGRRDAREEVVIRYRPLVVKTVRRLHGGGGSEELEDLIQVGMLGLLEALKRFDIEKGRFAPYARLTIAGTIKRHYRDRSWKMRIPRGLHDAAALVTLRAPRLEGELGRPPTADEFASVTGLPADRVREAQQLLADPAPRSLEASIAGDGANLADVTGCEDPGIRRAELRGTIAALGAGLDRDERELLARSFGLGQTQSEIAERTGGSQMGVSRRLRSVLESMAHRARESETGA